MEERIEKLEHENRILKLRSTEEGDSSTRVMELEDELQESIRLKGSLEGQLKLVQQRLLTIEEENSSLRMDQETRHLKPTAAAAVDLGS